MAILIGVIALAVIPNIQRSRESKDLSTLDAVASAVNVAVAGLKKADVPTTAQDVKAGITNATPTKFFTAVKENLGDQTLDLGSTAALENSGKIYCKVTFTGDVPKIEIWAGVEGTPAGNECKYTKDPDHFKVTN